MGEEDEPPAPVPQPAVKSVQPRTPAAPAAAPASPIAEAPAPAIESATPGLFGRIARSLFLKTEPAADEVEPTAEEAAPKPAEAEATDETSEEGRNRRRRGRRGGRGRRGTEQDHDSGAKLRLRKSRSSMRFARKHQMTIPMAAKAVGAVGAAAEAGAEVQNVRPPRVKLRSTPKRRKSRTRVQKIRPMMRPLTRTVRKAAIASAVVAAAGAAGAAGGVAKAKQVPRTKAWTPRSMKVATTTRTRTRTRTRTIGATACPRHAPGVPGQTTLTSYLTVRGAVRVASAGASGAWLLSP